MTLGAHMRPYSYMYCVPHRDEVLQCLVSRGKKQEERINKKDLNTIIIFIYQFKLILFILIYHYKN